MLIKLFKRKKLNNSGFTLVEMLIAIAILGIVGTAITGLVTMATHQYRGASNEVDVQYEAQQVANQIKDMIVDANQGVNMFTTYTDDTGAVLPYANPFFVIYNKETTTLGDGTKVEKYPVTKIVLDKSTNELYYGETVYNAVSDIDVTFNADNLLAKNIENFNVDTSEIENSKVSIALKFTENANSYSTEPIVALRNTVVATSDTSRIYSKNPVEKKGYILRVDIKKADAVVTSDTVVNSLTGAEVQYTADVQAVYASNEVEWTLEGSTSDVVGVPGSTISQDGKLTISAKEASATLTIKAISKYNSEKYATLSVTVLPRDPDTGYAKSINVSLINQTSGTNSVTYSYKADIEYYNADKLAADEIGCDWAIAMKNSEETLPSGVDLKNIVVKRGGTVLPAGTLLNVGDAITVEVDVFCPIEASEKEMVLTATTKAWDELGNNLSDSIDVTVGVITEVSSEPSIEWFADTPTNLDRNDSKEIGVIVSNLTIQNVQWSILKSECTGFVNYRDQFITWAYDNRYLTDNVELGAASRSESGECSIPITIDEDLNWVTSFTIVVQVKVTGSDGTVLTEKRSFKIDPVEIVVSRTDSTKLKYHKTNSGNGNDKGYLHGDMLFSLDVLNYKVTESMHPQIHFKIKPDSIDTVPARQISAEGDNLKVSLSYSNGTSISLNNKPNSVTVSVYMDHKEGIYTVNNQLNATSTMNWEVRRSY